MKVFVAHPYKSIPIEDYRSSFKLLEKDNRPVKFVFADEEITSDYILEKIERMIAEADISLFDLTTWNPNVAMELGMAYALKRQFYILFDPTKDNVEVPSDIRGKERIQYTSLTQLRTQLSIVLQKHLRSSEGVSAEYSALTNSILEYIKEYGPVAAKQIQDDLRIKKPVVSGVIAELREKNIVERQGQKRSAKYQVIG